MHCDTALKRNCFAKPANSKGDSVRRAMADYDDVTVSEVIFVPPLTQLANGSDTDKNDAVVIHKKTTELENALGKRSKKRFL